MRTRDEIRARLSVMQGLDPFGWSLSDLQIYLPEQFKEGSEGEAEEPPTEATMKAKIVEYLPFAFEKAAGHRGLSANRSVHHMLNWGWLAGWDDLVAFAEADGNYPPYGVPILRKFAERVGFTVPDDINSWGARECKPGCDMGCNS